MKPHVGPKAISRALRAAKSISDGIHSVPGELKPGQLNAVHHAHEILKSVGLKLADGATLAKHLNRS